MRRRLLSLLLVFVLVLGMLPVTAMAADTTYTVTLPEEQVGYTIVPTDGSTNTVAAGGSYSFTIEAAEGYDISNVTVMTNQTDQLDPVDGVYTVSDIGSDVTIYVDGVQEKAKSYTIYLPETQEGYTIEVVDSVNPVVEGGTFVFKVIEEEGYDASEMVVKVNDVPLEAEDGVYTLTKIDQDQTVTVEGIKVKETVQTYTVTLTPGDTYSIAATEGSVSPVASGGSFSFTVYANQGYNMDNAVVKANGDELTLTDDVYTIVNITADQVVTVEGVEQNIENQKTVTVPTGAEVHVYYQNGYDKTTGNGYDKEIKSVKTVDNGETVTYYYSVGSAGGTYVAFYGDKIPYAGYFNSVTDVVLSWDGETKTPSYRGEYDKDTTFGARGEDSVYTNVNSNGHLVLDEEFMLRSYRGWQIINSDTTNVMIEPEFNYDASNSNITITPYNDREENDRTVTASGTSSNNWVYLTPNGEGITYLEIGYDAVHIVNGWEAGTSGGAYGQPSNFTWNASDENRTALIVVQTDGNAASGINFGIQSPSGGWDYEYDTVYFTESQGSITMIPTGDVATVSVSHDKGGSYETVTGTDGTYIVPIIPGNNIIRITDSSGKTAFQVVRGEKISYSIANITEGKEPDEDVYPGDTVRITFDGMHTVCPKISGVYNPGYPSINKLYYTLDGETTVTQSTGYQYDFHSNVWIEVTVGITDAVLTGGYMHTPQAAGDSIGALYQAAAINSSGTGAYGRNILPDITINVIETEDRAPQIQGESTIDATVQVGFPYELNLKTVFWDLANDTITYYSDSGDGWQEIAAQYSFVPDTAGEYTVKFKAVDSGGKESEVLTLNITVEAVTGSWDGSTKTEVTPNADGVYEISTAAELAWFADQLNANTGNRGWSAVLTADIYLNNKTWPIIANKATSSTAYSGTFDGQGHTIYGLKVESDTKSGLFGYVTGTIQNLSVHGSVTATGNYVGGIAAQANSPAKFINCLANVTVTGGDYVGGLVGSSTGATFEGCVNLGDVSGDQYVGGIAYSGTGTTSISNCYNRGDITATGEKSAGGLTAVRASSMKPTITNSYSTGNVSGGTYTGKIAGSYGDNISDCYSITESTLINSGNFYSNGTEVPADTLKTYASTLGDAWTDDTTGINDGYPVLTWQNPSGTVTPETYTVTLPENPVGYTIAPAEGSASSVEKGGSFSFTVTPLEGYDPATLVVKANDETLTANEDGSYTVESVTQDVTVTVTISVLEETNSLPTKTGEDIVIEDMRLGQWEDIDLADYFTDADGDELTYYILENGAEDWAALTGSTYSYFPAGDGEQVVAFMALDESMTLEEAEVNENTALLTLTANVAEAPSEVTVTFSVTQGIDKFYTSDEDDILAAQEITVPYFDLEPYGLKDYYYNPRCYASYAPGTIGNGVAGTKDSAAGIVTTLHVFIWATEVYQLNMEPQHLGTGVSYKQGLLQEYLSVSQNAGSAFVNLWNTTNQNYYLNMQYPLGCPGTGSTCDQQALYDGDMISIHVIEDTVVMGSSFSALVVDQNGVYDYASDVTAATVEKGESITLTAYNSQSDWINYTTNYVAYSDAPVVYTTEFEADSSGWESLGTTDENGRIIIDTSDLSAGTYYIAVQGVVDSDASQEREMAMFTLTVEGDSAPEVVYGDVNGDGNVLPDDATLILQKAAEMEVAINEAAADVNCDGNILPDDATLVLQVAAELIPSLPVQGNN